MGNCLAPDTEDRLSSKLIEMELQRLTKGAKNVMKLLLLGPGESGKSTFVKQLRIIYSHGFTHEEVISYTSNIHSNIILSMSALLKALVKSNQFDSLDEELKFHAQRLLSPDIFVTTELTPELGRSISLLWESPIVKERFQSKNDVQIIDSASFFFNEVERIASPDYLPTEQDIIFCRVKTSGIIEFSFCLGGTPIRLVDVGGQRTERRKWIHCFEDVSAILYVAAINEFDEKLRENENVSRIQESLNLLAEITSQSYFSHTPVILLLNKVDLLEEKLKRIAFKQFFRDYTGEEEVGEVTAYLKKKFCEKKRSSGKLHCHVSCAARTENVKFIFGTLEKQILEENLSNVGLPNL